jgi:acyl dehydratase
MNLQQVREKQFPVVEQVYTETDAIRYALSLGVGLAPTDPHHLRYVYEQWKEGLAALPSMASVLAYAGHWSRDPALGFDWRRILHGEQRIVLHRPVPTAGHVTSKTRIVAIEDKGRERGAVMSATREIRYLASREPIATVTMVTFLRGDGGCGAYGEPCEPLVPVPSRAPDVVRDFTTSPQAGLMYRLAGDVNPVHADPETAAQAGFPAPILHGLCTFGVATFELMELACQHRPEHVREMAVRFTAPVYPGETLRTEGWKDGDVVRFRTCVPARGVTVLDRGLVRVG